MLAAQSSNPTHFPVNTITSISIPPQARPRSTSAASALAAQNEDTNVITILLSHGVDVNQTDKFGNTALHYASAWGNLKAVRVLVAAGGDVGKQNQWKWTPVDYSITVQAEVQLRNFTKPVNPVSTLDAPPRRSLDERRRAGSVGEGGPGVSGGMGALRRPPIGLGIGQERSGSLGQINTFAGSSSMGNLNLSSPALNGAGGGGGGGAGGGGTVTPTGYQFPPFLPTRDAGGGSPRQAMPPTPLRQRMMSSPTTATANSSSQHQVPPPPPQQQTTKPPSQPSRIIPGGVRLVNAEDSEDKATDSSASVSASDKELSDSDTETPFAGGVKTSSPAATTRMRTRTGSAQEEMKARHRAVSIEGGRMPGAF